MIINIIFYKIINDINTCFENIRLKNKASSNFPFFWIINKFDTSPFFNIFI